MATTIGTFIAYVREYFLAFLAGLRIGYLDLATLDVPS